MVFLVIVLADTMTGIMLCDISKVFTYAFPKSSLGVTNVLLETYYAGNALYDGVGFAVAMSDGVVFTSSNRTGNRACMVSFYAVSA